MADNLKVNGVAIDPDRAVDLQKTVTLPSGGVAEIRKGKGKDLRRVMRRVARPDMAAPAESDEVIFGLIAELVSVDGHRIVVEDLDEMPLSDVLMLQTEVLGGNFPRARQRPSSSLPSEESPSQN